MCLQFRDWIEKFLNYLKYIRVVSIAPPPPHPPPDSPSLPQLMQGAYYMNLFESRLTRNQKIIIVKIWKYLIIDIFFECFCHSRNYWNWFVIVQIILFVRLQFLFCWKNPHIYGLSKYICVSAANFNSLFRTPLREASSFIFSNNLQTVLGLGAY